MIRFITENQDLIRQGEIGEIITKKEFYVGL